MSLARRLDPSVLAGFAFMAFGAGVGAAAAFAQQQQHDRVRHFWHFTITPTGAQIRVIWLP